MALQKQNVPINFSKGIDTKVDPFQLPIGNFAELKNSIFDKLGMMKKRNGYASMTTSIYNPLTLSSKYFGTNVAAGKFISEFNDEILIGDGKDLFSYSNSQTAWAYKGRLTTLEPTISPVVVTGGDQALSDGTINVASGFSLYAWEIDSGCNYSVIDSTTKQVLINNGVVSATGSRPQCFYFNSKSYVSYVEGQNLKIAEVTSAGIQAATTVFTDLDATLPNYDIQPNGSGLYVAYNRSGGTVRVSLLNTSLAVSASINPADTATNGIGISFDGSGNAWVFFATTSAVKYFIVDSTVVTTVLAITTIDSGATAASCLNVTATITSSTATVFYDQPNNPTPGALIGFTGGFTVPAVNSNVNVNPAQTFDQSRVGEIIYIGTAGYYQIISIAGTVCTAKNLGYSGNAAPATVIGAGQRIHYVADYQDSVINFNTATLAGSVGTVGTFIKSMAISSKAFLFDGIPHVLALHSSPIQPTYFLCNLYNYESATQTVKANIAGKFLQSQSGKRVSKTVLPHVNTVSSGIYSISVQKRDFIYNSVIGGEQFVDNSSIVTLSQDGVSNLTIDFTVSNPQSEVLGKNIHFGSGTIVMYDGASVCEHGFNLFPETFYIDETGASGSLGSNKLYGYKIVYEWTDNFGQIHQSAPSPSLSWLTSGTSTYLTIPTLRATNKKNVNIVIYRTLENGSTYFRVNNPTAPLDNDITVNNVNFLDTASDDSIQVNEQLYTTGEIENICAPSSVVMSVFKNRIFLIPSENKISLNYSKQVIEGSPVEFSDFFSLNTGTYGGDITAIAVMDDKLIIFKEKSIYYINGTGPAASGANNDFSEPLNIPSDVGCTDPNSLVLSPNGLMFKSRKGIYLLGRGLDIQYIGNEADEYNSQEVLDAKMFPSVNQIRFLLSGTTSLMYNYFVDQWGTIESISGVSDLIYNDLHYYIDSSGVVHYETPSVYADGATPVVMSFKTGWINLAGLQGFERAYCIYLLAKYLSDHTLTVSLAVDYNPTIVQTMTITPDSSDSIEQWRVFLTQQKCESFQLTVQENATTAGAGFTMSGFNLTVGIKDGKPRISAARSTG